MRDFLLTVKLELKKILPRAIFEFILACFRFVKNPIQTLHLFFLFKKRKIVSIDCGGGIKYKIVLDPSNGFLDKYIFLFRKHEPEIKEIFRKYVNEGDNVLDIGMNIGEHSLFLSFLVGENGRIFSFEPIKRLVEQAEESIKINNINNITINNFALGDVESRSFINIGHDHLGGSTILDSEDSLEKESIEIKVLDSIELPRINFIKIDTEGFEWNVIKGARRLIEKDSPNIIFEFNPFQYDDAKSFLSYLLSLKYQLYDIENNVYISKDLEVYLKSFIKNTYNSSTNILATKIS